MNLIGFTILPLGKDIGELKDNWERYFELNDFNRWLRAYDENESVFIYSPDTRTKKILSIFGKDMLMEIGVSTPSFLFFVYLGHDDNIYIGIGKGSILRIFSRGFKRLGGKTSKILTADLVNFYKGNVCEGKYLQLNSRFGFFGFENTD